MQCITDSGMSCQIKTKLCCMADRPVRAGCYSRAAMSLTDSRAGPGKTADYESIVLAYSLRNMICCSIPRQSKLLSINWEP